MRETESASEGTRSCAFSNSRLPFARTFTAQPSCEVRQPFDYAGDNVMDGNNREQPFT
jgi:hypothetical protein